MTANTSISLEKDTAIYSREQLSLIDPRKVPDHIAVIMDGNRRWAKQRNLPFMMGHWEGAEVLIDTVQAAIELGIKTLTVYSFSTENWGRPENEIDALMNIFEVYLTGKRDLMVREGIKLYAIGDLSAIPPKVRDALGKTKKMTENGEKINLVIALNYGGRDEICRAVRRILKENESQKVEVTEELIAKHLDTSSFSDPKLLIRTSGQHRLSNFLLWQLSYAHLYMSDVLWPDFSSQNLFDAVMNYIENTPKRDFGR